MFTGLVEGRSDTVQDDVEKVVVCHLVIDIPYLHIIQLSLHRTCQSEITDLVKNPIQLIVEAIVFTHSGLDLFLAIIPVTISFPPL